MSPGLIDQADRLNLHDERYWHILLHYKPSWFGVESLIDDPAFFLYEEGKNDPRSELHATLRAFFQPLEDEEKGHPICRFIARFTWLKEQLGIDTTKLPFSACSIFHDVYDFIEPTSVTFIFPAAYLNSPASMFGHTLIVFDSKERNRLLSRAVSYAARTDETFGPLFAVAAMIGVYKGITRYCPITIKWKSMAI